MDTEDNSTIMRVVVWVVVVLAIIAVVMILFGLGSDTDKANAATIGDAQAMAPPGATVVAVDQNGFDYETPIKSIAYTPTTPTLNGYFDCRGVYGQNVYENWLGFDLLKTTITVRWCWNGNKVSNLDITKSCQTTTGAFLDQWRVTGCDKNGHFFSWKGSAQGAYEAHVYGHYEQVVLGYQSNRHSHNSEMKVHANGAANWVCNC